MLKKFFEWIWPLAICLLLSMFLIRISWYIWNGYINWISSWNVFWIMTSILWLTLASVTFFISKLIELEEKFWKLFKSTRKEIHENIILSLLTVIIFLLGIVIFPENPENLYIKYWVNVVSLSLLFLQLFSFLEVCMVMIKFKTIDDK